MLKFHHCFFVAGMIFGANALAADTPAAAIVNGKAVPQASLDFLVEARMAQGAADTPELREALRAHLIDREILAQEAVREGIDKDPGITAELEQSKRALLAATLVQRHRATHEISEEALRKEYERQKAELGAKEYLPSHILADSGAKAAQIIARLEQGEDFKKLVTENSKDEESVKTGGSLGWSVPSDFEQPFAEALQALKKGEYTKKPVQTQMGWHVIKLDDERPVQPPAFEEMKAGLQESMQRRQIDELIAALRSKAQISQ